MHENPLWNICATFLLTASVIMLTDFSHRLLGSDPDGVGIFSITVQALFAVAATSTFTKAGWSWMQNLFAQFRIPARSQARWKVLLAGGLFAVVCSAWIWMPQKLAGFYNDRGFHERSTDSAAALQNYQRAISLNPGLSRAHFNLAELYESFYQYDKASMAYQSAIVSDHLYVKGYNNLARVLLLENQSLTALRVVDDGLALGHDPSDTETEAALRKNRAWAEYELGFYEQAISDAKLSSRAAPSSAAPYCLLGKTYGKLGRREEAEEAWISFSKLTAAGEANALQPMVEPDCKRLAQGASHETK